MNDKELEEKVGKFKESLTFKNVAKSVTGIVVRNSVGAVAVVIIRSLVPDEALSKKQKLQLSVATWAMSGAAASSSARWASNRVVDNIEFVEGIVEYIKNEQKPSEEKAVQEEVNPINEEDAQDPV